MKTALWDLIEQHRYRMAHERAGKIAAQAPEDVVDPTMAVLLGRLAFRLGAPERGQDYLNQARKLDPGADEVLVWAGGPPALPDPVAWLHHMEKEPRPDRPEFQRSQAGSRINFLAGLRLFDRAEAEFQTHGGEASSDSWILHSGAFLRLNQDRWEDAWNLAVAAWKEPGYPSTAELLFRLGPRTDAPGWPELLWQGTKAQSYQLELCRYQAAAFQIESGAPPEVWMPLAREAAADAREAAVLAEPAVLELFKSMEEDLALLKPLAPKASLVRRFQGFNECVPAGLATSLSVWGGDSRVKEWARSMLWGGTQTLDAVRALRAAGWWVRVLSLDAASAGTLVDAGIPFNIAARGEFSGHSLAGLDRDAKGRFRLHDPDGTRLVTWEFPTGGDPIEGLVVLPADRLDLQALVPVGDSRELEEHLKALEAAEDASRPWKWDGAAGEWEERTRIHWLLGTGRVDEARVAAEAWTAGSPESLEARKLLLHILSFSNDRAEYRRRLRCRSDESSLLALAEELSRSRTDRDEARHLLGQLAAQARSGRIYQALTQWALTHGEAAVALTASEIAAALEPTSEPIALLRAQVLARTSPRAAVDFLEARVSELGSGFKGAAVVRTWTEFCGSLSDQNDWSRALTLHPADPKIREAAGEQASPEDQRETAGWLLEQGWVGAAARLQALAALGTPGEDALPRLLEWHRFRPWDQAAWSWLRRVSPGWTPDNPPPTWTGFLYQEGGPEALSLWRVLHETDSSSPWLWREEAYRRLAAAKRAAWTPASLAAFEISVAAVEELDTASMPSRALRIERDWERSADAWTASRQFAALWSEDPSYTYAGQRSLDLIELLSPEQRQEVLDALEVRSRDPDGAGVAERLLEELGRWRGALAAEDLAYVWLEGSDALAAAALSFLRWARAPRTPWTELVELTARRPPSLRWDRYRIEADLLAGQQEKARDRAVSRLKTLPRDLGLRRQIIRSWWDQKQWAEGWKVWEEGLGLPGLDIDSWTGLAAVALQSPRGPRALDAWHKAPPGISGSLTALLAKARWEESLERKGDAESTLRRAAAEYPASPLPLVALARSFDGVRPDADVVALLEQAYLLDRGNWDTVDYLACYRPEVLDAHLEPPREGYQAARGRKAWFLQQSGDSAQAQSLLLTALTRHPGYEWGWRCLLAWTRGAWEPYWAEALASPMLFGLLWEERAQQPVPDGILDSFEALVRGRPSWGDLLGPAWIDLVRERRGAEQADALLQRWAGFEPLVAAYLQCRAVLEGGDGEAAWTQWQTLDKDRRLAWEYRLLAEAGESPSAGHLAEPVVRSFLSPSASLPTLQRALQVWGDKGDELFAPWPEHQRILGWTGGPAWPSRLLEEFLNRSEPTLQNAQLLNLLLERAEDNAPFGWFDELQPRLRSWEIFDPIWLRRGYHLSRKEQKFPHHWWYMRHWKERPGAEFWAVVNLVSVLSASHWLPLKPPRWWADPLALAIELLDTLSPDRLLRWAVSVAIDTALKRNRLDTARSLAVRYQGLWDRSAESAQHFWPGRWPAARTEAFEKLVRSLPQAVPDSLAGLAVGVDTPAWLFRSERRLGGVSRQRLWSGRYWWGRLVHRWKRFGPVAKASVPYGVGLLVLAGFSAIVLGGLVASGSAFKGLGVVLFVGAIWLWRRR